MTADRPATLPAGLASRLLQTLTALAGLAGFALVLHFQPYGRLLPASAGLLLAALAFASPQAGIALAIALLPVADLTAFTGVVHATEADLVWCAVIGGAALRFAAWPPKVTSASRPATGPSLLVFGAVALSYALSYLHALSPWPGLHAGSFAGYAAPLTGLRLGKGFLLALGLLIVVRAGLRTHAARTADALRVGVVASLALVSLAVLWERLSFTGLTDLSSDYRATGPFWEMHVGGAQLDGWIALTLPMAGWGLLRSRRLVPSLFAAGVAGSRSTRCW